MNIQDQRFLSSINYDPSWRGKEARTSDELTDDPYVNRYRNFLSDQWHSEDYPIQVAHDIYRTETLRCEIEAYLMADATFEEIASRFDVSSEAIECYARLFFDIAPLNGPGSRKRVAHDPSVTPNVRKARQYGYRYGKLFLDWYSSRLASLEKHESARLDACIETVLKMKIFDLDKLTLCDGDKIQVAIKLLDALTRYKAAMNKSDDDKEFNSVLDELKTLIHRQAPPQGLPGDIFKERIAKPQRNGN